MTIDDFIKKGILVKQESSKREIDDLLKIVDRDIADSEIDDISLDWQFGIAYNAALKLATILIRASGHRVKGQGHHINTIALIPIILGRDKRDDSEYLDVCRRKRNIVEYDYVGGVTEAEVRELKTFVLEFRKIVLDWIKN